MSWRGRAQRLIGKSDMRPADRLVFARMLRRSDNNTGQVPAQFALSVGWPGSVRRRARQPDRLRDPARWGTAAV